MVIPESEDFNDAQGYTGFFLEVLEESSGELQPSELSGCWSENWPPDQFAYYDGELVDREGEQGKSIPTKIFVASDANISGGTRWVIDQVRTCGNSYVGLEVSRVSTMTGDGGAVDNVSTEANNTATDTNPIPQPGFGPVAGVAGALAGAAALARRHRTQE